MKNWKKYVLCAVVFLMAFILSAGFVFGAESAVRVFDLADLFDDAEERALAEKIDALREKMNMDAAVVTVEENDRSAEEFADKFYEEQGLGVGADHDGVLFLIDMENGELYISTEGKMLRYLTDSRIEAILDDVIEYAYDGQFLEAAEVFLDDVEICYDNGIASNQYNQDTVTGKVDRYHSIQWYEFLFAIVVAAAAAGGAVLSVVREYGMKNNAERLAANFKLSYRKDSSFAPGRALADILIGSYVTHSVIASATRNGGGSGGGRSLSSGGRTSTHRSSSGRVHGGGGRKFR